MPLDLHHPVPITLPLGAWNTVLGFIAKQPWDIADPLMQAMRSQIGEAQQDPPRATLYPREAS